MDQEYDDSQNASAVVRRRRKIIRPLRDKTPEPRLASQVRKNSDDTESSSTAFTRPPGPISAHESKILRRRDKTFTGTAARSHSQPREAEKVSHPEAFEILKMNTVKRSLSSPRNKDESSEGEHYITQREHRSPSIKNKYSPVTDQTEDTLTRLERNLQRFEDERRYFDLEKKRFEKEKREHKQRYRQIMDTEERRKVFENYRKNSDRINFPSDAEEKRRLIQSLRQSYRETVSSPKPPLLKPRFPEESSAISSSDSEQVHGEVRLKRPNLPPPVPERKIVSRHSSLSPIRPPEQLYENLPRKRPPSNSRKEQTPPVQYEEKEFYIKAKPNKENVRKRSTSSSIERDLKAVSSRLVERKPSLEREKVQKRKDSIPEEETIIGALKTQEKDVQIVKPLRRRSKIPLELNEDETKPIPAVEKSTLYSKISSIFKRKPKPETAVEIGEESLSKRQRIVEFYRNCRIEWTQIKADYPEEINEFKVVRNKCFAHFIVLILMCGFGGLMFRYTEGAIENIYKCEVRKVKRDFLDQLWTQSHNMREDDWKSSARNRLRKFEEELVNYHELAGKSIPGAKSWNFVNCVIYCWTVVTTIGYGHMVPKTVFGRSLTIIYAIIGIPLFLILLADFGKVFTRGMKVLWAYVRRLYYHGTCRKVRKQQQFQDMMSGFNTMYDMAIRRPSTMFGPNQEGLHVDDIESGTQPRIPPTTPQSIGTHLSVPHTNMDTPTTPYPETIEIDDEFNLPISLASTILILYILIGAIAFTLLEDWTWFESFYFVFISMSTIGFGDFVPNNPIFMMLSILYFVFGLALTSMFINVVQIKLSDTFKGASAKIGTTIGLTMAEEGLSQLESPNIEIPSVHSMSGVNSIPEQGSGLRVNMDSPPPLPKRYVDLPQPPPAPAPVEKKTRRKFFGKK